MNSVVQLRSNVRSRTDSASSQPQKEGERDWDLLWEEALASKDPLRLFDVLANRLADFGFDQVAYVNFQHSADLLEGKSTDGPDGAANARRTVNYGEDWIEFYGREGYFEDDVLFDLALTNQRPIEWDQVQTSIDLTKRQQEIFDAGFDAGHRFGVTIPFHGPVGRVATLSISTSGSQSDIPRDPVQVFALSAQFHAMFDALAGSKELVPPPPRLSAREYECLSWAAQGKSNRDIAQIIGISDPTVQFHMGNVMKKLKVSSRVSAVFEASRMGLLR
ncbi:helix-turn-helix transcriptional regulator [Candidatus Phaeomarinobacter ectocarpi]|uniref:helix-turn-helix transcriptional regulator n=1 Tax=Candidatus Phaeomarinibacter ectocarpi TaxID=1458461 RepID=UPI0009DD6C29|nr:LuxR family transcriptional regulator [Candidatus Phaeomarinobacter ectocarpi]